MTTTPAPGLLRAPVSVTKLEDYKHCQNLGSELASVAGPLVSGAAEWRTGLPLYRVRPETVHRPADSGPDPVTPAVHHLTPSDNLQSYLNTAGPGTVLQLASGTYTGNFWLTADRSGTPDNPVVIRGEPGARAVLAGAYGANSGPPVLDIGASYTRVEDLTIRDALRAIRFPDQTDASGRRYPVTGAVVRRVHTVNTNYAVATGSDNSIGMTNAYICDNVFAGVITDPHAHYGDGSGNSPDWDGVQFGTGSVICHNTFSGFGDRHGHRERGRACVRSTCTATTCCGHTTTGWRPTTAKATFGCSATGSSTPTCR